MIQLKIRSKTNTWNDYFSVSSQQTESSKTYESRINISSTSVYVLNCLFNKCVSNSYGGALASSATEMLLIESSLFHSCSSSAIYGGAIYFENANNGQCILNIICSFNCTSTLMNSNSWGQFAYVIIKNQIGCKNYANYTSIVHTNSKNINSLNTLRLQYGTISVPSTNISGNECGKRPGILCSPVSSSELNSPCIIKYSSFVNNTASSCDCIYFENTGAKKEMRYCNVIRNSQILAAQGTIYSDGSLIIEESCILENNASHVFFQNSGSTYSITISNCTTDAITKYSGGFIIDKTAGNSFINGLIHIETWNCHSSFDSVNGLTVHPIKGSKKKRIICFTNGDYYKCMRNGYNIDMLRYMQYISMISINTYNS